MELSVCLRVEKAKNETGASVCPGDRKAKVKVAWSRGYQMAWASLHAFMETIKKRPTHSVERVINAKMIALKLLTQRERNISIDQYLFSQLNLVAFFSKPQQQILRK